MVFVNSVADLIGNHFSRKARRYLLAEPPVLPYVQRQFRSHIDDALRAEEGRSLLRPENTLTIRRRLEIEVRRFGEPRLAQEVHNFWGYDEEKYRHSFGRFLSSGQCSNTFQRDYHTLMREVGQKDLALEELQKVVESTSLFPTEKVYSTIRDHFPSSTRYIQSWLAVTTGRLQLVALATACLHDDPLEVQYQAILGMVIPDVVQDIADTVVVHLAKGVYGLH